ncbi:hypothetical protein pb186bvf_008855 [Paramecium bursaria]
MDDQNLQTEIKRINFSHKHTQTDPIILRRQFAITFKQILFIIFMIIGSIILYIDIQARLNIRLNNLLHDARKCNQDYEFQKCDLNLPVQRKYCDQLERCMIINWDQQSSIELSAIMGEIFEQFFDKLSFRSYMFLLIPFLLLVILIIKCL